MWEVSIYLRWIKLSSPKQGAMVLSFFLVFLSGACLKPVCGEAATSSDSRSKSIENELILTKEEKIAFDKFKDAVYSNITHPFIRQDIYLLRWIRSKGLDVDRATQDMFEFMDFLRKNRVSAKILEEDWSDMKEDHPFYFDVVDREGRPVAYGSAGDGWNIRRTILHGKRARFMRYTYYIAFQLMEKFMEISKTRPNVTQCMALVNMQGFNVFQHSCPMCVTSYIQLLELYERFIPGYVKDIVIVNAPQAYLVLLEVLRPIMSPQTRAALRVFSTNKNVWKPFIDERIDPNQLPTYFGGNRVEN